MFLKSLEIRGFKSFADKTELEFKKGVTTVVGPNGSGKSNISDAVRWVLGEQSVKNLRGGKMEDVIFSGTQYRKPVGLAQVSLTLDNNDSTLQTDYSHVTVTRRIFRSGESEYLLNNTQCRLKDITALFMDTGIGKEGYSIIGQGKIDAILSGKPEERRNLLEEAAGIVKYKTRKVEAERKLSNTEQNLIRINDIISTYEERLEPLKIQSEKALEFLDLSNLLKAKEVSMLVHKIENSEIQLKKQNDIINQIKIKSESLKNELNSSKENLKKFEDELESLEKNSNEERVLFYKSKENSKELSSEIDVLIERIKNIETTMNENNKLFNEFNEKKNKVKDLKDTLEKELLNKKETKESLKKELYSLSDECAKIKNAVRNKENELALINNEKKISEKAFNDINNEIALINNKIINIEDNIKNLRSSYKNYENSLKINISTKDMVQNKIYEVKTEIEKLNFEIKIKKTELNKINKNIQSIEENLRKTSEEGNKLEGNKNVLENLEKQYEGYARSVKYLMEHINKGYVTVSKTNVLGDILDVPKEYERAIEIALGGSISNIITEDENDAKKLIQYLKQKKLGRATFLPLNIIQGRTLNIDAQIKNKEGFIGLASELLTVHIKYKNIVDSILGRTIVCNDMDSALNVAKFLKYKYKIVTLEGEVINPGGALTGGSIYGKHSSIISRKREIEELLNKIEKARYEFKALKNSLNLAKIELKEKDEEILNLKDGIHGHNVEIATLENETLNIEKDTQRISKSLKISDEEIKFNESKLEKFKIEYTLLNNKKNDLTSDEDGFSKKIESFQNEIKVLNQKLNNTNEKITLKKIEEAKSDEIFSSKSNDIFRLNSEISDLENKIHGLKNSKIECKENLILWNNKIKSNEEDIKKLSQIILTLEKKFKDSEFKRIGIKDKIKALNEVIGSLFIEDRKLEEEIHKKELSKTKTEGERENYFKKLNEEYSKTFAEAEEIAFKINSEDEEALLKEIAGLKGKINSLGNVNVSSIDEYKDVKEKYTFMWTQKEDLTKAKEELVSVILEMTDKMKYVFKDNFKILNEYFSETFKELFKGGSAKLVLAEGDELTANIDINVQPPGKKVQNINLMSGGEKVLSAIALLFSILKMKPTPFCILDEIEAALDDANVFRYAEFLKKFSSNIQFIVITHRKGTMEASDLMYGVTMEEKGVSKVVSVNFNE